MPVCLCLYSHIASPRLIACIHFSRLSVVNSSSREDLFLITDDIRKVKSLCPNHFCCYSRKLHKEPFLLSYSHLTTSAFVTICLGTNMVDSNRRQDKSHRVETNPCQNVYKWKRRKVERNKRSSQSNRKAKLTDLSGWSLHFATQTRRAKI